MNPRRGSTHSRLRAGVVGALVIAGVVLAATLPGLSVPGISASTVRTVAAGSPAQVVQAANGGHRPNIMVVMLDDMRFDELRFAPNTRAYLLGRGLDFRNSFSPYPLCCPARASFLLGKYAHNHRVLYHDAPYGFGSIDDSITIATRMRAAGYQTALVGKYLNRYGIMPSKVTGRSSVHYVPNGWTDWKVGLDNGWHRGPDGTYDYFDFTQNVNGTVVHHKGTYSSRVVADQVTGLISKYHRRQAPFFMWVTPVAPHFGGPNEPDDPPTTTMSNGQRVRFRTPARPGWVKGRFNSVIQQANGVRADGGPSEADVSDKPRNIRRWPEPGPVEKRYMRNMERQRAESIFAWDRQFGRIVTRLKETGEYQHTVLMFTSDNGYYLGEHRMRQGKVKAHEPVLRVPFLVAGPGIQHGQRYVPITTFDLTRTILDLGQARALPRMDGSSRLGQMTGPDAPWRTAEVTEGLLPGLQRNVSGFPAGLTTSGLRTGRYKLILYSTGEGELYDLWNDPNELHSLYHATAYAPLRRQLVGLWNQYKTCVGDGCRVPLPTSLQTSPSFLAQEWTRSRQAYNAYFR